MSPTLYAISVGCWLVCCCRVLCRTSKTQIGTALALIVFYTTGEAARYLVFTAMPKPLIVTKTLLSLIFTFVCVLLTCCKPSYNGKYLIYSTKEVDGNDTITNYLKSTLQGKRFNIAFAEKYVSLKGDQTTKEIILASSPTQKQLYTVEYKRGEASYSIKLIRATGLEMQVQCTMPKGKPIVMPVQFGGEFSNAKDFGIVTCYLSKVEQ